jgi:phospholipid/cholesterol/gamma-HCH transport system ATP-binding protein
MTTDHPFIEFRNLSVRFGRQQVLRGIDLAIERGETVAVIGESGSGKTVMLKTLIGLVQPAQGEVVFDGHVLNRLSERELTDLRTRFGYVFQNAALFDSMTIRDNVLFPLRQHGRGSEAEYAQIIRARLAEVGLTEGVLEKKPAELSGGMRKRVGLARALVMSPEVLLYDEPTTGLDPIMSDVINELILRTRSRYPVTSIVVTHDMRTAQKVADRVVMVYPLARLKPHEPQVVYDGPADRVEQAKDSRVREFVLGDARERMEEMQQTADELASALGS